MAVPKYIREVPRPVNTVVIDNGKNPLLHSVEILAMISASYGGGADGDAERYNRT